MTVLRPPLPCPICGKPAQTSTRPFCSDRCVDIDLGRWFGERYSVPADTEAPPEELADEDAG